ncbi:MAG TPA: hypothetical protein VNI77_03140, partial [Nitrososphaera sp.]|nr:hypothetical protein [Nitrososphaera sp.]
MLIISIAIGFLLSLASYQPGGCYDLAEFKQLLKGSPQSRYEYRGRYINRAYEYSVRIPDGLTAYDGRHQAKHTGFWLALGEPPQSFIFVSGDYNSVEYSTSLEAATRRIEWLRESGKKLEFETITESHLGTLDAVLLEVIYTCPGSATSYRHSSIIAISPEKGFLYELELY